MPVKTAKKKPVKTPAKKSAAKRRAKSPGEEHKPDPEQQTAGSAGTAPDALPAKQQAFIVEYLANGFNATQAAITAGYAKKNADTQGSRLLANPKIAAIVAAKTKNSLAKREITADAVIDEIAKVAFLDPRKLFTIGGGLVPIHELDDSTAMAIAGIKATEMTVGKGRGKKTVGYLKTIKIADKLRALELLGRRLKLFTDKVEHSADKEFVLTVNSILSGGKK